MAATRRTVLVLGLIWLSLMAGGWPTGQAAPAMDDRHDADQPHAAAGLAALPDPVVEAVRCGRCAGVAACFALIPPASLPHITPSVIWLPRHRPGQQPAGLKPAPERRPPRG